MEEPTHLIYDRSSLYGHAQLNTNRILKYAPYYFIYMSHGSGIRRIREGFINYGLHPPDFGNFQHGFQVIAYGVMRIV